MTSQRVNANSGKSGINVRAGRAALIGSAILAAILTIEPGVQAQTFTVLHSFGPNTFDGYEPLSGVTVDKEGNLYGTTTFGGESGSGVAYELLHQGAGWAYSKLFSFTMSSGYFPIGKVAIGPDSALYGTATAGGTENEGTIFRLRPPRIFCVVCPWEADVLHNFYYRTDGSSPNNINFDVAGNFYGTTSSGGPAGAGTVYKMASSPERSWTFSLLSDFANVKAGAPYGGVVPDQYGNVYGEATDPGTVFEVTNTGSTKVLHSFHFTDGDDPYYGVVLDGQGNVFGQTAVGGINGDGGTAFELSPSGRSWTFNLIYSFAGIIMNGKIGAAALSIDSQGNLYGTTFGNGAYGHGTVFKLSPLQNDFVYTDLHDFTGYDDGCAPWSDVVMDSRGNLYGTASGCGSGGGGTVWEITP
jgi:uncharacterized repeat protein (TIGR03803 family)